MVAEDFDATYEEMTDGLEGLVGAKVSLATIRRFVLGIGKCNEGEKWKTVTKKTHTPLSETQMKARLEFLQLHRRNPWTDWVNIDEKWFYLWVPRRKVKVPGGHAALKKPMQARSHIPKVMFLTAICRPRPEHNFNGLIGIWRVCLPYEAKKASVNHEKGEVYDKDCTMDAALFRKIMTQKVF